MYVLKITKPYCESNKEQVKIDIQTLIYNDELDIRSLYFDKNAEYCDILCYLEFEREKDLYYAITKIYEICCKDLYFYLVDSKTYEDITIIPADSARYYMDKLKKKESIPTPPKKDEVKKRYNDALPFIIAIIGISIMVSYFV